MTDLNKVKTNFCKVMEFNRAFDMVPQEPQEYSCYYKDSDFMLKYDILNNIRKDIFIKSPEIIKLRLALIKEELDELNDAIIKIDIIEQRDACADILYVVYGMADVLGIAIDDYFINKIKINIDYYINNNLSDNLDLKLKLTGNSYETKSNFTKIKLTAEQILGFKLSSIPKSNIINLIKNNLFNLYSELENSCNIQTNNNETIINKFELVANNLFELLKWAYLMTHIIGADADADFAIVHESNMSKLCDNIEDAEATVKDYQVKFIAGVSPYSTPYHYYLPTLNKWIVKNLTTGKALKNIKYKKVSFKNPRFVF